MDQEQEVQDQQMTMVAEELVMVEQEEPEILVLEPLGLEVLHMVTAPTQQQLDLEEAEAEKQVVIKVILMGEMEEVEYTSMPQLV